MDVNTLKMRPRCDDHRMRNKERHSLSLIRLILSLSLELASSTTHALSLSLKPFLFSLTQLYLPYLHYAISRCILCRIISPILVSSSIIIIRESQFVATHLLTRHICKKCVTRVETNLCNRQN